MFLSPIGFTRDPRFLLTSTVHTGARWLVVDWPASKSTNGSSSIVIIRVGRPTIPYVDKRRKMSATRDRVLLPSSPRFRWVSRTVVDVSADQKDLHIMYPYILHVLPRSRVVTSGPANERTSRRNRRKYCVQ